ncbi:MAG: NUDIX hydrolase [Deltaproteobacteria bacterium]|nr:NUDIX hydrolase [Deltaproteobacteria bacterium]
MSRRYNDDPAPWQTLAREYVIRDAPYFTLRRDHLRLPGGAEIPRYWITEFPPWVNVVAITRQQEVVLIRQYRPGLAGVHFELPAGFVDAADKDDFEQAARRELLEETGFGGGSWQPLCQLAPNPAMQNNFSHSFVARDVEIIANPNPEATEDLRVHLIPNHAVLELIDSGQVAQALHAAPLLRYLLGQVR